MEGSSSLLQQLGFSEYDLDDVKQLVSETSLKMLALTYETHSESCLVLELRTRACVCGLSSGCQAQSQRFLAFLFF
jgi:hypothetical protein